jgi:hypothetical protein
LHFAWLFWRCSAEDGNFGLGVSGSLMLLFFDL